MRKTRSTTPSLARSIVHSAAAAPAQRVEVDFGPYLERLDRTLQGLATAQSTKVVQSLTPGVIGIFKRLTTAVSDSLIPAVQSYGRQMRANNIEDRGLSRQLDRTLRDLDQLKELVDSLEKIDTSELVDG